jgi:uncharacterized SAM-binding protein YcdF (DUF218 family)/glycosyltransferase involved in cell wall biosynthesis
MDYIIISSIDWSCNWQIHQQLATSLVESGHRVLFIENTGVRAPRVGDFGRVIARIRTWLKSTRGFFDVREHLTVFSPLFVPFPYSRLALFINRHLLSRATSKWIKINRFNDLVLITFLPTPLADSLIRALDPSLVIYYCADEMAGRSTGAAQLRQYEDVFFTKVDAVFCTSSALADRATAFSKQVSLFPAGVDFAKFANARNSAGFPCDLRSLARPIIGYVGAISSVFDQELLAYAARALPEATFVLIGPEIVDVTVLIAFPNVRLMGKRPHCDVPEYIKAFDVALIPYVVNASTDAVYSCKLNEYLAMGTAVVTTDMREVRLYAESHGNVFEIGKTREEFVEKIQEALAAAPDENKRSARIAAARANSWDKRFEGISHVIAQLLSTKKDERLDWPSQLTSYYRQGRMRIIKTGLILGACYLTLFYTPILWFAGNLLVVRDAPTTVDAIVVFSGDGAPSYVNMNYLKRSKDALLLYSAKYSSRIVLSTGKKSSISEDEVVRSLLLSYGVPPGAISIIEANPKSTEENIRLTAAKLKHDGAHKIIFVTAPYHSLRAHLTWKKLAPELMVSTVSVVDTPSEKLQWNTRFKTAKVIAYEYMAIAYYWWKEWL